MAVRSIHDMIPFGSFLTVRQVYIFGKCSKNRGGLVNGDERASVVQSLGVHVYTLKLFKLEAATAAYTVSYIDIEKGGEHGS